MYFVYTVNTLKSQKEPEKNKPKKSHQPPKFSNTPSPKSSTIPKSHMKKAERGVAPLTNTMHKQLGLGREVVIDDVVKLWNVNTTSCQVCDDHDLDLLLLELGHMDFASCLVQGTVDVGTANSTLGQQLWKNKTKKKMVP